jgi:hypothetical protein
MNELLRLIALTAKMRTGLGAQYIVCDLIGAASLFVAFGCLSLAGFVWLEEHYGEIDAALVLGGGFLLIAILAFSVGAMVRRRNIERARIELAEGRNAWLDPKLVSAGLEVGKSLGWHRIAALAAVGVLAAAVAREWSGESRSKSGEGDPPAGS